MKLLYFIFLHENNHFLFNIITIYTPKRISRKCFKKKFSRELPHGKDVCLKYLKIFLKTKSDPNIHQNAPNCTILKNFLGQGACHRTTLAKRMASPYAAIRFATCIFLNLKKVLAPSAKSWVRPCN